MAINNPQDEDLRCEAVGDRLYRFLNAAPAVNGTKSVYTGARAKDAWSRLSHAEREAELKEAHDRAGLSEEDLTQLDAVPHPSWYRKLFDNSPPCFFPHCRRPVHGFALTCRQCPDPQARCHVQCAGLQLRDLGQVIAFTREGNGFVCRCHPLETAPSAGEGACLMCGQSVASNGSYPCGGPACPARVHVECLRVVIKPPYEWRCQEHVGDKRFFVMEAQAEASGALGALVAVAADAADAASLLPFGVHPDTAWIGPALLQNDAALDPVMPRALDQLLHLASGVVMLDARSQTRLKPALAGAFAADVPLREEQWDALMSATFPDFGGGADIPRAEGETLRALYTRVCASRHTEESTPRSCALKLYRALAERPLAESVSAQRAALYAQAAQAAHEAQPVHLLRRMICQPTP